MKKLYLWICLVSLISGCRSEMDGFQQDILRFARDGKLDAAEHQQLVNFARNSGDHRIRVICYTGPRFDEVKLDSYLRKFLASKALAVAMPLERAPDITPFRVQVYLENSASMDGYVNGPTRFKDDTYALLGDLALNKWCDDLSLHYINSSIPFTKDHAGPDDIRGFIQTLTPAMFRKRGGDRSSSDLRQVLQTVLDRTNDRQVSIVISDFVFSPGKKVNAEDYLNNERIGIKLAFTRKLQSFHLSLLVFQCYSNFKGYYYDAMDHPVMLSGERPFYIWVLGSEGQLGALLKNGLLGSVRAVATHQVLLQPFPPAAATGYKILYDGRIGTFRLQEGAQGPLSQIAPASSGRNAGRFSFKVNVDFSGVLQDNSFFSDSSNYELNKGYQLAAHPINDPGFTHQLTLTTTMPREEQVHIAVRNRLPAWVLAGDSANDSAIASRPAEQKRTFGLKYLLSGVFDAFYPSGEHDTVCSLNIQLNK